MGTQDFYNKIASKYENSGASTEEDPKIIEKLSEIFSKHNITGGTILDLGCGPGNLKTALGDSFEYTCVDISENMLTHAKEKGYKTILGKIEEETLKLPDKSFDYVVSLGALLFVKDIHKTLSEIDRIAKKAWLVSLDDITDEYKKEAEFGPMYNHSKMDLSDIQEDIYFCGWKSKTTGRVINSRVVFRKFSG